MKGLWENGEVQALFSQVEDCKNKNRTLREAFIAHAQKYNRQPNSVRNYYYHEVDQLGQNANRVKALGIDLDKHRKNSITYFSQKEESLLMQKISKLVGEGVSVRKACFILSNGDVGQMLRYQNKYRNYIAKNSRKNHSDKPRVEEAFCGDNIIAFQKKPKMMTDAEVQALFMGLVRLVKKNTEIEGEEKFKCEIGKANDLLRKALTQISSQEREIEKLKADYLKVKEENQKLLNLQVAQRCKMAEEIRKQGEGAE